MIRTSTSWDETIARKVIYLFIISSGSSYLQGEGLKVLSGEKQTALQDQVATAEATKTVLEEENRELQKRV